MAPYFQSPLTADAALEKEVSFPRSYFYFAMQAMAEFTRKQFARAEQCGKIAIKERGAIHYRVVK